MYCFICKLLQARLKEAFDHCDEDDGGSIDKSEIVALCEELMGEFDFDMDSQRLGSAMSEMDEDGNGDVTFDELCHWWYRTHYIKRIRDLAFHRWLLMLFLFYPSLTNAGAGMCPSYTGEPCS